MSPQSPRRFDDVIGQVLKKSPEVIAATLESYTPVASPPPAPQLPPQQYPWEGLSTAAEKFAWALPLKDSYNLTNDYLQTLAKGIVDDPKYEWMKENANIIITTGYVR